MSSTCYTQINNLPVYAADLANESVQEPIAPDEEVLDGIEAIEQDKDKEEEEEKRRQKELNKRNEIAFSVLAGLVVLISILCCVCTRRTFKWCVGLCNICKRP